MLARAAETHASREVPGGYLPGPRDAPARVPGEAPPKTEATVSGFFTCFGFFGSLPARDLPLAMILS